MDCRFDWSLMTWRPGIGDPTMVGWVTVALYVLVAAQAAWTAWAAQSLPGPEAPAADPSRRARALWGSLAVACAALAINKQLDLQSVLTDVGRVVLRGCDLYAHKRTVQLGIIGGVVFACVVAAAFAFWWLRGLVGTVGPALLGLCGLLGFIALRATSFHHMDALIDARALGLRFNGILELGSLSILAAGIEWGRRHPVLR